VEWLGLAWLGFDLLGALAGGRHYPHYFLALTPSLAVLAGLAYRALMEPKGRREALEPPALALGAPRGLAASMGAWTWPGRRLLPIALFALVLGPMLPRQAYDLAAARALLLNGPPAYEDRLLADLLERRRTPGDTLFSWTYRPAVFLSTGMRAPGRVLDAHYVGDSTAAQATFGQDILADLRRRPPAFLVDGTPDQDALARTDPIYREFLALARGDYVLVHVTPRDRLRLYERRDRSRT
jgi:hypothetical protein